MAAIARCVLLRRLGVRARRQQRQSAERAPAAPLPPPQPPPAAPPAVHTSFPPSSRSLAAPC
jgi:hypothetical protein